jgi:hypothetical protein
MRRRTALAVVVALVIAGQASAANDQLVAVLKQLGKAVDDMSANISTAATDADAQLLANVTRQALDNGLKQDRPTISIEASASYCRVLIETPKWKLWSEARSGKITDHGAAIH